MTTMSLRLPASLHKRLRELSREEGVSMNQIITAAIGEKMAALMTMEYLEDRAMKGSRAKFKGVLKNVPDVAAPQEDQLPDRSSHRKRTAPSKRKTGTQARPRPRK